MLFVLLAFLALCVNFIASSTRRLALYTAVVSLLRSCDADFTFSLLPATGLLHPTLSSGNEKCEKGAKAEKKELDKKSVGARADALRYYSPRKKFAHTHARKKHTRMQHIKPGNDGKICFCKLFFPLQVGTFSIAKKSALTIVGNAWLKRNRFTATTFVLFGEENPIVHTR